MTSVFVEGHTWPQEWAWQLPESSVPYAATHHSLSYSGLPPPFEHPSEGFPNKLQGMGAGCLRFVYIG